MTVIALCEFIVECLSMMYWITVYLKLRLLWRRKMRSGYFLTCFGMVVFIILARGMVYF